MNIRILHEDGIDELYQGVVKILFADNVYYVYTQISTFTIPGEVVKFIQVWEDAA